MASPTVVDIATKGDVVLICGEEGKTTRILVSSLILSYASPVFNAMLATRFKEGLQLATNSHVEIPLPDDDASAMAKLCQVMHFRKNNLPAHLSVEELINLARLTDKYDCSEAMMHSAYYWIDKHMRTKSENIRSTLLEAAFFFKDKEHFERIVKDLVFKSTSFFVPEIADCPVKLSRVFDFLSKQITQSHRAIAIALDGLVDGIGQPPRGLQKSCSSDCNYQAKYCLAFMTALRDSGLFPLSLRIEHSLENILADMEGFKFMPDLSICSNGFQGKPGCIGCYIDTSAETKRTLSRAVADIRGKIIMPCAECAFQNQMSQKAACGHKTKSK